MPKTLTILLVALLPLFVAAADVAAGEGPTAAYCFTKAPGSVLEFIPDNTRLDMIDYFTAGSDKASDNNVGGKCRITAMDDESISLEASEGVDYQIFVLNRNSGAPLIGVIETLSTPIPDSRMRLYDQRWLRLPSLQMPEPGLKDWLTPQGRKHADEVREALPFILSTYSYDPATQTLTVANNMAEYFTANDTPAAMSYIRDAIRYKWDGKKFRPVDK